MEDFQEQEYEFLRRLEEERSDRRTLLRRGIGAGVGLTVLSLSPAALAARKQVLKDPPGRGKGTTIKELVAEAKKEGGLNTIALPPDWANYGEIMSTFSKKYGVPISNANPNGSSSEENQAVRSLKGDPRAPDVLDVSPAFAIQGANEGLYAKYFNTKVNKVPRAMKDGRGFWVGDYWGAISLGANKGVVSTVPKTYKDLLKPDVQEPGRSEREPAHLGLGSGRRVRGSDRERWVAEQHPAGDRLLRAAEERRELHPGAGHAPDGRVGPDADRDRLGLPEHRVHQGVPGGEVVGDHPGRRRLRGVLLPGHQRHGSASVGGTALAGVHLLGPGAAALAQGVLASGAVHRHGGSQGRAESARQRAPGREPLCEGEVRQRRPSHEGTGAHQRAVGRQGRILGPGHRSARGGRPPAGPPRAARRRPSFAWIGVIPFFAFTAMFLIIPSAEVMIGAFKTTAGGFTFDNVLDVVRTANLRNAFKQSIEISLVTAIAGGLLGLLIAYAAIREGTPRWIRSAFGTFSGVAANFGGIPLAFAFIATLGTIGIVTQFLENAFGFDLYEHGFSLFTKTGVELAYLYFQIPLMILIIAPAIDGLRAEWREASSNLGASSYQYWRYIALPVLFPSILGAVILLFGNSFAAYATAYGLTSSGLNLVPIIIGADLRGNVLTNPHEGQALALGMFVVLAAMMLFYIPLQRRASRWAK